MKEMSVSTCYTVGLPFLVPGGDFLVVELSEIEIVLESLVDCVCFTDMAKSLKTALSSSEALFCMDFSGKSVLLEAFLKECCFLSDPTYLKCWKNLFEIGLLLP